MACAPSGKLEEILKRNLRTKAHQKKEEIQEVLQEEEEENEEKDDKIAARLDRHR